MIVPKLQVPFFGDNETNIIPTGSNLITNGSFNASLTGWAVSNYVWSAGTAAYDWSGGGYMGSIEQTVALVANKKYKLTFKYKAETPFTINVRVVDGSNPSILIGEQVTSTSVSNGLWQLYEAYIISPVDMNVDIIIENVAICDNSVNPSICVYAEEGFFLDDVTLFETKRINRNCESCDTVVMDSNKNIEFQVKIVPDEDAEILNEPFDTNPHDEVTLTGGAFAFDILSLPAIDQEFIIYICGSVFRFTASNQPIGGGSPAEITPTDVGFEITVNGNNVGDFRTYLASAIVDAIDLTCGTTTILVSNTIGIYNVTGTPYISDPSSLLDNVVTSTPSGKYAYNFLWDDTGNPSIPTTSGKMCYDKFVYADNAYQFTADLVNGTRYKFSIGYSSDFADFVFNLRVDDGSNPVQVIPFDIIATSQGTADVYFTALDTATTSMVLELVDASNNNTGFCFDYYVLSTASVTDFIDEIRVVDCNGTETVVAFDYEIYRDNLLIQLPLQTGVIKIILVDAEGNEYESVNINMVDFNTLATCMRNQYIKLTWFDNCNLGDIDYTNLPFMNEVYFLGSIKEVNNIQKERVNYITPTGALEPIFSHSLISQTIIIANYSNTLHRLIAKIFEHRYFYVNDERGKIDNSKYEIIKLKDGMSSGEVEYIVDGTELVNSSCCC